MARTYLSVLTEETWIAEKIVLLIETTNYSVGYSGSNELQFIEYLKNNNYSNHILLVKPVRAYQKAYIESNLQSLTKINIIIIGPSIAPSQIGIIQSSGISGYINEPDIKQNIILEIIEKIYRYGYFANHQIPEDFWKNHPKTQQILPQPKLSKREKEVLFLICHNYSTNEIALLFHTQTSNVRNVINRLKTKTFANTTMALVALSIGSGWIKINPDKFKGNSPFIRNIAKN